MCSFVFDGVFVMIRVRNGVVKFLKDENLLILFFYCLVYKFVFVCVSFVDIFDYIVYCEL